MAEVPSPNAVSPTQSVDAEVKRIHSLFFLKDGKECEWEERIKGLQAVQALVANAQLVGSPKFAKLLETVLAADIDHQVRLFFWCSQNAFLFMFRFFFTASGVGFICGLAWRFCGSARLD